MLEHSPGHPLKLKDLSRHGNSVLTSKAVKQKDVYSTFKYFAQTACSFHVIQNGKSINFVFAFFSKLPGKISQVSPVVPKTMNTHIFLVAFCLLLSRHTVVFSLVFLQ